MREREKSKRKKWNENKGHSDSERVGEIQRVGENGYAIS